MDFITNYLKTAVKSYKTPVTIAQTNEFVSLHFDFKDIAAYVETQATWGTGTLEAIFIDSVTNELVARKQIEQG